MQQQNCWAKEFNVIVNVNREIFAGRVHQHHARNQGVRDRVRCDIDQVGTVIVRNNTHALWEHPMIELIDLVAYALQGRQ